MYDDAARGDCGQRKARKNVKVSEKESDLDAGGPPNSDAAKIFWTDGYFLQSIQMRRMRESYVPQGMAPK